MLLNVPAAVAEGRHGQVLLAAVQLTKLGEAELAWISAERGLSAARETGDPVIIGSLFRSVTHALLSTGRFVEAVRLTENAAGYLEPALRRPTPELLSVYGTLFLAGSVAPPVPTTSHPPSRS